MPDPITMQRLAFIRYCYTVALDQSRQPEPMSALSILGFHDSVELFLQLASEHLDVGKSKASFMEYWGIINPAVEPRNLSQRETMRRLNNARVSLKHHGTRPSNLDIEGFRAATTSFFKENTSLVFNTDFDAVTLVDFVQHELAQSKLREAEQAVAQHDFASAMVAITVAFHHLIDDVNDRFLHRWHRSPFDFGEDFTFESSFFRRSGLSTDRDQDRFEDKLVSTVESTQKAMKVIALGIDYQRYAYFDLLTPAVRRTFEGTYHVQIVQGMAGSIDWPPTAAACRFCFDFVIDSAMRLMNIDAEPPN